MPQRKTTNCLGQKKIAEELSRRAEATKRVIDELVKEMTIAVGALELRTPEIPATPERFRRV